MATTVKDPACGMDIDPTTAAVYGPCSNNYIHFSRLQSWHGHPWLAGIDGFTRRQRN